LTASLFIRQPTSLPPAASNGHQRRVEFLQSLASLLSAHVPLERLADGGVPDVLREDIAGTLLFIGEAKHSERPEDKATQSRLLGYFESASLSVSSGRTLIFGLCFGAIDQAHRWIVTLQSLALDAGLGPPEVIETHFETGLHVIWLTWRPTVVSQE
jgi:hypothetical protein